MKILPDNIKGLILDMDGVLWQDTAPIGDLPRIFAHIKQLGLGVTMATNNSSQTPEQYVQRLAKFGVQVEPWQVVTSSLAVAALLKTHFPAGTPLFAIGENGVRQALSEAGYELLPVEKAAQAEAVVMGIDRLINFEKIAEAALLVRAGKPFFATNTDRTFPTPRGQIPGAGSWISIITSASDVQPIVAGKPSGYMMEMAAARLGTSRADTLVVGDRLETDIAGGQAFGSPSALVLSGVSTLAQAQAWSPAIDIIVADLATLLGA